MIRKIDSLLNLITMYKLVLYSLLGLAIVSIGMSLFGLLPFQPLQLLVNLVLLAGVCFVANKVSSSIFKVPMNDESYFITAVILFFILTPSTNLEDLVITVGVGVLAILSKFLLAFKKKHIFNPAAIAILIISLFGFGNAIWWVGSSILLPLVLLIGLLVIRKLRRIQMFLTFSISALITILFFNLEHNIDVSTSLTQAFNSWPLIFFGTIMLTEPATSPSRSKFYLPFAVLVGILFGSQFQFGPVFSSPELSLVIGNIFAFVVGSKQKLFLTLLKKVELAPNIYEFVFRSETKAEFLAGQYMEWTVPDVKSDIKGNRRYFTLASSPAESDIRIAIKANPEKCSTFKKALLEMKANDLVVASQLSGDFVLPDNITADQTLVFIAGGIGITPFRSMVKYLLDNNKTAQIVMFYSCLKAEEFVYLDIFDQAKEVMNLKLVQVISDEKSVPEKWSGEKGYLNEPMIKKYLPYLDNSLFYLSGPNVMVESYRDLLKSMKVSSSKITTDYFSGY